MSACWKCGAAIPDGMTECAQCPGGQPTETFTAAANPLRVAIDFNKVTSFEDLKLILSELGLTVTEGSPAHERLRRFCAD